MSEKQESYWTYKAPYTPIHAEAVAIGAFKETEAEWHQLSPGMRREILRQATRRATERGTDDDNRG